MRARSVIGGTVCLLLASASFAQNWADVDGRIQFAYYTEDVRALNGVLNVLKPKLEEGEKEDSGPDAGQRAYFRGLVHYRLAQVLAVNKKSQARSAINDCGKEVDRALDALPKVPVGLDESDAAKHQRAEAYALDTACKLAGREMSSMPFGGGRVGSRIEEAVKLEPRNPRVRLMEALVAYDRAGKDAAEKAAAVQQLREVTVMFETARAGATTIPEWGAAQAYAYLGHALYDQRDVVGAREALERALLIAPDYAYARRLATQITR